MRYEACEAWLFDRRRLGMKYGLDRMESVMSLLGHPEKDFRTVHVVGTNGKGSTAAILSSIAGNLGISWGRTTSPHLLDYRERVVVNDQWITEDAVAEFVTANRPMLEEHSATFFEITTALAAWYFAGMGAEWVAAEAGLGGRLDATRTFSGLGTVFTGVRVEHSRILGNTREKIAREKIAIAEKNTSLFAHTQSSDVESVIEDAVEKMCLRRIVPKPVEWSPLPGKHQLDNTALALCAAEHLFGMGSERTREALAGSRLGENWPGRLDYRLGSPSMLFDVAHNPQSMKALIRHIAGWQKPIPAVVGFLSDKPWKKMVKHLSGAAGPVITTTPDSERKLEADELATYMRTQGFDARPCPDIDQAVERCRLLARGGPILVTGSFFVVGRAINTAVSRGWVGGVPNSASHA